MIKLEEVRGIDDDDYVVLEKLTRHIKQLATTARTKNQDDEAKVRFLTKVVIGTPWGLSTTAQNQ